MRWYVEWTIDAETETPLEAAQAAWEHMRRPDSTACVFEVADENGMTVNVDLGEPVGKAVSEHSWWVPNPTQMADLAEWMAKEQWDITEIVEMIRRPQKYKDEYSKMLSDRAFDVVAKEPEVEELEDSSVSSVQVRFIPEAWVNDHAIEVDTDWDQDTWFVSEETARAIARQLTKKEHDWDWVREQPEALKWCKEWTGPFTVEILADGHAFEEGVYAGACQHCGEGEFLH